MKIAVLGAGAWGTALAIRFAERHDVALWSYKPEEIDAIRQQGINERYLPGIPLPATLRLSSDLSEVIHGAELLVIATSMAGLRPTLCNLRQLGSKTPLIWVCKGLEAGSMKLPHQVADEEMEASIPRGTLSGPSFAQEVAQGLPAAVTLASSDGEFARRTAEQLNSNVLRLYASDDIVGVEIGGAVKNVLAIAAGVCDGLKLGFNARAALLTRGLAEMTRFGVALGAKAETFIGLSGAGDLILTATGDLSRNRRVGLMLAEGRGLDDILHSLGHVAEGVPTAREVRDQAGKLGIDMPITRAVCRLLFEQAPPRDVLAELMERAPKMESEQ
ncbi:glycerol-3-phosphate dehydrogenase (NAD(P)+) [Formivibrio citricus]|uniref:Glycerol-3-phosphate dehydrogenase [NAD(P)+] n=1 Tax=Formivibrio citricus TaxID=83765 RepID=A0A1I4Z7A4_9NEIS|nr:NAD(P)H-dependent glycerol-3-phosphate dehydrogenase [Formivibrio citricus]SFN45770.1 glycerol-3-phosphate dehydrogenase (NAD(P)+) [Formivibrio citricus]